jgi:hypothetical protein
MLPLALACLLPAGCGSSGSDSPAATTTPISGTVTAGPVDGCQLTVLDATGTNVAGPVTSHQGAFTVNIPDSRLGEGLVFECTGGTFTDEATGNNTAAGTLSAQLNVNALAAGVTVNLTPGSTVIRKMLHAGIARSVAEAAFSGAFGYTPDSSVAPKVTGGGTDAENLAGLRAGVFSRLTANLGKLPAQQFDLLTAIAEDLADGTLNGVGATTMVLPSDLGNRFVACLIAQGTAMGLASDHLGTLPFAKVAETATYRIEYQAGMMGAAQGKTVFKLKITDRATGNPVTGAAANLALNAVMAMPTKSHGTPIDSTITEPSAGVYQCTIYYLMASSMNNMPAGYWSLDVTLSNETATFHPDVAMSMGDTSRASLKDANDKIAGGSVRTYFLFKDSLTGVTGNHNLSLFLACRETLMSHPALVVGQSLHNESGTAWTVDTVMVEVSTNSGTSWTPMTNNGGGHWSVAGLTGLTKDVAGTVLVRLTVNGVEKTTTGAAGGAQAAFTVTPK